MKIDNHMSGEKKPENFLSLQVHNEVNFKLKADHKINSNPHNLMLTINLIKKRIKKKIRCPH